MDLTTGQKIAILYIGSNLGGKYDCPLDHEYFEYNFKPEDLYYNGIRFVCISCVDGYTDGKLTLAEALDRI